jgi:YHS domain-containing protein
MRIHCDACSVPFEKDAAVVMSDSDGELFYFCSAACAEAAETLDPGRELERAEEARPR